MLPDSPFAVSTGETVETKGYPFVWLPGQKPFHVLRPDLLKVKCPERYKSYAHRVEANVPIWRETLTLQHPSTAGDWLHTAVPGAPGAAELEPADPSEALGEPPPLPPLIPPDTPPAEGEEEVPAQPEPGDDEQQTVPDVPVDVEGEGEDDIFYRSRSRAALKAEAQTVKHKLCHYPHNPYCEVCVRAHMTQQRFARSSNRDDDQLPAFSEALRMIATDHIIVAKSKADARRISASGSTCVHTVRDEYSGLCHVVPQRERTAEANERNLRFFIAPVDPVERTVLCRTDCDAALVNAIEATGMTPNPSLENRWPHNVRLERFHRTLKSAARAALLQAGFPCDAWDLALPYAAVALGFTQMAPLLDWEKDANGAPLEECVAKSRMSCYECHTGSPWTGLDAVFGQLVFYLTRAVDLHPVDERTRPGLFIGWRLEAGMRHRDQLFVADFDGVRSRGFRWSNVK